MGDRFDTDAFVASCYEALEETDPAAAVSELVAHAVRVHGRRIGDRVATLHSSSRLTVQVIAWPAGSLTDPHEHSMWAVVGVFGGEETNRFYTSPDGSGRLARAGGRVLSAGEVMRLGGDAVHDAASTGSVPLGALHVYGGDLPGASRRAWDPGGRAGPYDEVVVGRRRMFQAIAAVERATGVPLDDDCRRRALLALWAAASGAGRHLDTDESVSVVRAALAQA